MWGSRIDQISERALAPDPFLEDMLMTVVVGKHSLCQMAQHSKHLAHDYELITGELGQVEMLGAKTATAGMLSTTSP